MGFDALAWVVELDVDIVGDLASACTDVGDEHVREFVEGIWSALAAGDGHWCTIHIHLAVAHFVEPSPSEGVVATGDVIRDRVGEGVGRIAIGILWEIAAGFIRGAATDDGVDDLEFGVLGGCLVGCQRQLTRATAMDSTSLERESLWCPGRGGVLYRFVIFVGWGLVDAWTLLAGIVGTRCVQGRVIQGAASVREGRGDKHVPGCGGEEGREGSGEGQLREHVGCVKEGSGDAQCFYVEDPWLW